MKDWDIITLRGLTASGSHGVYDFEREGCQDFVADLTLYVDSRRAADTDDIADTVDYSRVAGDAVALLTGPSVYLIETLASRLAELALSYEGVFRAQVTIHKPMAPLKEQFTDVAVTVVRERRGTSVLPVAKQTPREEAPVEAEGVQPPALLVPASAPALHPDLGRENEERSAAVSKPVTGAGLASETALSPVEVPASVQSRVGRHQGRTQEPRFSRTNKRKSTVVYEVVLALGSNRGNSQETLRGAVEALALLDGFQIDAVSPLIRTKPVLEPGALPQDDYLNAIVVGKTLLAPPALLAATQKIEADFGRVRRTHWGSRTLDIDIIDMDKMRLNARSLTLPHPRAGSRAFVLYPWLRIDAEARLPGLGKARDLLPQTTDLAGILAEYPEWLSPGAVGGLGPETPLELAPRPHEVIPNPPTEKVRKVYLRGEPVRLAQIDRDPIFEDLLAKEQIRAGMVPRAVARSAPKASVPVPPKPRIPRRFRSVRAAEETPTAQPAVPAPQQVRPAEIRQPGMRPAAPSIPVQPMVEPVDTSIPVRSGAHLQVPTDVSDTQDLAVPVVDSPETAFFHGRLSQEADPLPEWNFRDREDPIRVVDSTDTAPATQRQEADPSTASPLAVSPRTTQIGRVTRGVTVRPTKTGSVPIPRINRSAKN